MTSPRQLVMIPMENTCMFCEYPIGKTNLYTIAHYDNLGYFACDNCQDSAKNALSYWHDTIAFGKVAYLKDKTIKVKRTMLNGKRAIEDGWKLSHPITRVEEDRELVYCHNEEKGIGRWCYSDEIIELNPTEK